MMRNSLKQIIPSTFKFSRWRTMYDLFLHLFFLQTNQYNLYLSIDIHTYIYTHTHAHMYISLQANKHRYLKREKEMKINEVVVLSHERRNVEKSID